MAESLRDISSASPGENSTTRCIREYRNVDFTIMICQIIFGIVINISYYGIAKYYIVGLHNTILYLVVVFYFKTVIHL